MQIKRFIIDNDGTNLFVLKSPLTEADLQWTVNQCPKSVTTYMVCPNIIGKFCYPCSVGEPLPKEVAPHLIDAFERGEDYFGKLLTLLKQSGKEVFVTYRMNDVHNANDSDHWGISEFKKRNPELTVDPKATKAGTGDWMSYCLDYSKKQVQNYVISSLKDIVDKYDIDGIQLDWMRFPRHLSGNSPQEVWEKRHALTEFSYSVRNMLDKLGQSRGKKILLSARIPTWLEGCKRLGVDVKEWHKIIDFITVAPFLSCDYHINFSEFRELFPEKPIYAGTDMNHSGRCHNSESYRAWALCMFDQGADGINIFNFPCWTEYLAEQPYDWIADISDEESIKNKSALYTLISNYYRVPNIDQFGILPIKIDPNNVKDAEAMKREPEVKDCCSFIVPDDQFKAGENVLSFTNIDNKEINISRVDLGIWY
ncbi:MAG: glycosyl hydrolase family 18 protein [Candidatus Poribacteria bacterium]